MIKNSLALNVNVLHCHLCCFLHHRSNKKKLSNLLLIHQWCACDMKANLMVKLQCHNIIIMNKYVVARYTKYKKKITKSSSLFGAPSICPHCKLISKMKYTNRNTRVAWQIKLNHRANKQRKRKKTPRENYQQYGARSI